MDGGFIHGETKIGTIFELKYGASFVAQSNLMNRLVRLLKGTNV